MAACSLSASASSSLKFAPFCSPRPPETTTRALASSGRSETRQLLADDLDLPVVGRRNDAFDRAAAAARRRRVEAGGTHGDDLPGVLRLHRGEGVAGIDGPHEGVCRFDGDDVGNLRDVEQRGDARRDILAEPGGRQQDMGVRARRARPPARRGSPPSARRIAAHRHATPWPPLQPAQRPGLQPAALWPATRTWIGAADLLRRSNGVARRRLERSAVVFGDDEDHKAGTTG